MIRIDGRRVDQLRQVKITPDFSSFAEGSCLIEMGNTVVLCNASVEDKIPPHVKQGGWVTAEYAMLPRANRLRSGRDIAKLKLAGRSAEIQRLIGRSLRSVTDLSALGERTITIDCDVLQGDGGTRTASVTGGFLALAFALRRLVDGGALDTVPLKGLISGISAGIVDNVPMLDLCYEEDSRAMVDMNCVMTADGKIVELQATGEARPYSREEQDALLDLCRQGNAALIELLGRYMR